jgi:predicted O-methyltransferase YrrM
MKPTDIQGWMEGAAMRWLSQQSKIRQTIVEIGVWKGRSSACMAEHAIGTIWSIDHFNGNPKAHKTVHKQAIDDRIGLIAECKANLKEWIDKGTIQLLVMDNKEAVKHLQEIGVKPDMIFIDGDHTTESVTHDIRRWKPLLQPGGMLCGHDIGWDSVKTAVDKECPGWKPVPECTIWTYEIPK